jgi:hypothetical protein
MDSPMQNRLSRFAILLVLAATPGCIAGHDNLSADAASAFVADPFKAPDGTRLDAHSNGQPWKWVKHTVRNLDTAVITDGRVHHDGGGADAIYYVSAAPNSSEYDVTADIYVASNVPMLFTGVCGRMSTDAKTMYVVWYSHSNTRWQLARFEGGTLTGLGEYLHTPEPGKVYRVTLQLRNDEKRVLIDDVERISSRDNVITEPGRPGLYFTAQDPLRDKASSSGHQIEQFWAARP